MTKFFVRNFYQFLITANYFRLLDITFVKFKIHKCYVGTWNDCKKKKYQTTYCLITIYYKQSFYQI